MILLLLCFCGSCCGFRRAVDTEEEENEDWATSVVAVGFVVVLGNVVGVVLFVGHGGLSALPLGKKTASTTLMVTSRGSASAPRGVRIHMSRS